MSLPEEKFDNAVWYVLKKIRERSLYADTEKHIPYFVASNNNSSLPPDDEIRILRKLEKDGIIEMMDPNSIDLSKPDVYIDIIQSAFNELYEFHRIFTNTNQKKNKFIKLKRFKTKKATKLALTLYLDMNSNLWRDPKNKYCYKMVKNSNRYKIVRYLATNKNYQKTSEISSFLENKSEQSIRTEISKIRNNIHKFIKIDGRKILEGEKGSGYRINPEYRIQIKKD